MDLGDVRVLDSLQQMRKFLELQDFFLANSPFLLDLHRKLLELRIADLINATKCSGANFAANFVLVNSPLSIIGHARDRSLVYRFGHVGFEFEGVSSAWYCQRLVV